MIDVLFKLLLLALVWRAGSWARLATREVRGLRSELAATGLGAGLPRLAIVRGARGEG